MSAEVADYLAAKAAIDYTNAALSAVLGIAPWEDVDTALAGVGQAISAHLSEAEHELDYYTRLDEIDASDQQEATP